MPRRLGALTSRPVEDWEDAQNNSEPSSPRSKSRSYPNLAVCVVLMVIVLGILFVFGNTGFRHTHNEGSGRARRYLGAVNDGLLQESEKIAGDPSSGPKCRTNICAAVPILQEMYGKTLQRTLHLGPGTCGVVAELRKRDNFEVWGVQPFDMKQPIHSLCKRFIRKGIVRISDPYQPLPYRKKTFSFVLVTDILDQMTTKELNYTLLDIAGVSSHSVVLVVGDGGERSARTEKGRKLKPRNRMWWQRRFASLGLKEDMQQTKRFETLQSKKSFKTTSNIFHLYAPGSGRDF